MNITFHLFLWLSLFLFVGCSDSDSPSDAASRASGALETLLAHTQAKGGEAIVFDHATTLAHETQERGARTTTPPAKRFALDSPTKLMIATMIARLVDASVLEWEMKPADAFPELSGTIHEDYADVTLLDLLRHRGGTPDDQTARESGVFASGDESPARRRNAATMLLSAPAPMTKGAFGYSHAGYVLAVAMVEAHTNKSWQTLMETWLFAPLGIAPSLEEETLEVHLELEELARFLRIFLDAPHQSSFISHESLLALTTPLDEYGCGVVVVESQKGLLLTHAGHHRGALSAFGLLPNSDIGAAIVIQPGDEDGSVALLQALDSLL